jgi:hypothetical protein
MFTTIATATTTTITIIIIIIIIHSSFIFLSFPTWNIGLLSGFCAYTQLGLLWTSDQPVAETCT